MTTEEVQERVPLIVDPDPAFLNSCLSNPYAGKSPPLAARTGREAQLLMSQPGKKVCGFFVNPDVSSPGVVSVIRWAHHHYPATPIFLIYDKDNNFSEKDLKELGVQGALQKPLSYEQILKLVKPILTSIEFEQAVLLGRKNSAPVNTEVFEVDSEFLPISARDFLAGTKSFFDVYVRLNMGKYLKVLQSGDNFSPDRIVKYLEKGLSHFYLRKSDQELYLNYCDKLTSAILSSPSVPMELKVSQTLNQAEETLTFFKNNGISEVNLLYAAQFLTNLTQLIKQLNLNQHPIIKSFLSNFASYSHGVGVVTIAGLIVKSLSVSSSDPIEAVGLASLFHDIALTSLLPNHLDEDETKMTKDELAIYRVHPLKGAEILSAIPKIKPVVVQAVSQHHERRNRKGFPHQLGPGTISIVSEVVGLSDEFYRIIQKKEKDPSIDIQTEVEKNIRHCFSTSVISTFNELFHSVLT